MSRRRLRPRMNQPRVALSDLRRDKDALRRKLDMHGFCQVVSRGFVVGLVTVYGGPSGFAWDAP